MVGVLRALQAEDGVGHRVFVGEARLNPRNHMLIAEEARQTSVVVIQVRLQPRQNLIQRWRLRLLRMNRRRKPERHKPKHCNQRNGRERSSEAHSKAQLFARSYRMQSASESMPENRPPPVVSPRPRPVN